MAAGRTLVVMEGGHPWGFRIEGGAEVREPLRINKVLGGGKAYYHGIEVGDILSSINGEKASNMTISRARHLVRTSDDLLVLEVTRPVRGLPRIPEIRVISPNENLNTNGRGFQWGPNEVPDSQRYMVGMRSASTEGGSLPISKVPPMPPPKPARRLPLTARNPLMRPDPVMLTYPVSASQATPPPPPRMMMGHGRSPAVASGNASVVDDGTTWSQSQPTGRQSTRSATPVPRGPNQPGKWTFTLSSPPTSPRSGEVQPQRRNTEPAPIKPGGLSGYLIPGKPGVVDRESFGTWKTDPLERKEFRRQQRTTDSGSVDRSLSSTAVVLPLSSRSRTPVSENQFAGGNRFVAENPYDLLPNQEMLNLQGQNQPVHYQNSYNKRNLVSPSAMPQLEKSWSQKIEDFETGYHSSASHDDSNMYADYDFLPEKPMHQNNLRNSPREHAVLGDRAVFKDPISGRGDQLMYPDKRFGGVTTRQRLDEEKLRRKLEIERVIAEEKRRRYLKDLSDSTARRHSDYFTPLQRSSLLADRFSEDDEVADALARPVKRVYTKIRGKARALHAFRAQSYRELSFKKNDIIYILRQVDKNWFEGERHGMVGIFPITYVEVLTSLDEAKATAELREGTATAIYQFRAQTDRELPLRKGDMVTLIRRVDENWYEGRLGRRQGIFPVTYVETHREPETPMTTPMSSHAPTPLPGTPASCTSPVSSLYSVGPEIPSAPMSPLGSEFYESDWDTASIGALQAGRPMHTSRSSSPARSQMSDREVTPVQGAVSPFYTGPANRYAYEGHRVQGRSLPPKSSMLPYSQMADRDITPVRGVTSPTPTGSANTRYAFEGGRIVNQSQGSQPKPSSMAYNEFSDHEITPVREVTSPTPTGSTNVRYSFDGTRIIHESPSSQVKPSSLAYDQIDDHEITPVREMTSPTPTGSANTRYSLDRASIINPNPSSQLKISYYRISDREAMPERSVTSPPPTGSANARRSLDRTGITNQSPSLQPKPSSVTFNQISDREIMRVRGVTSPPPIGSPIEQYPDRMAPQNGPRVQCPSLQSKPSLHSYSQISDRYIMPDREVTSPPPTGSVLTRYSLDEAKIINESPGLQPKPSSLAYNKITDREIMRVRGITSPPPSGSPIEQYSDRTAPQNGPRIQSSGVQLKSSTVPESQIPDLEITPVRGVISPTPMVSASAQYPSDGSARSQRPSLPLKPSTLPQSQIPDRDMTPVKAVVCPSPTGSPVARVSYEDSKLQKPSLPAKPSMRPSSQTCDQETTPVRAVVSPSPSPPTPTGSANTRLSSEESTIQNPDSQQNPAVPSELQRRKEDILDPTSFKEIDKRSDSIEQTRGQSQGQGQGQVQGQVQGQGKSSGVSVDKNSTSVKPVVATKRPPSGRSASLTLRALKQKLPFFKHQEKQQEKKQQEKQQQQEQPPTEGEDRRDGLSKSPGTKNPYLRCRAVYDYKPQNIDELEVIRGDIIYVMEKCADGWFVGISEKTKKFGSFPGNFVRPA